MFLKGSSTENREKGFVTYFQGANKDTSNTTKQSTNFINFKKKSKRWGSPVSMILGRSLISSPTSAVCSLSVSEVLSSDAENSLIDIDSPNSKSSWLSTLWESKSKKSTASVKNQLIVEPTNIEQFRQSDILNDINSSNMTAAMTSGFDALMNENIHDQTVDSRVSSGNRSQRPHSNDSSTLRQPASTTVSIHSTVSKCPSEKILVESNAILLNNAHREERLQQRAGKINEVHETLSVLSRSLSNLNEFGILNVTPLSPLSRQINSVTNITLEENLESVPLFTNSATNSDTSIVKRSPCGRTLRLEVFSTWGDEFFVGLTGVEVFDDYGHLISIKPHITDIRLLHPESSNEHSSVWKLVDGMNFTCDDCHSWLVPIDQESKNLYSQAIAIIEIEFTNVIHPSLIRVFNFNKSRTHSFRGVRSCCLKLDETVIFKGDLKQAPGRLDSLDAVSQQWVFTESDDVLKIIHDIDLHIGASSKQDGSETIIDTNTAVTRPLTSGDDLLLGHAEEHAEIPISNPSVASLRVNLLPRSSPTRDRPLRPSASISRLGSLDETEIVTTPSKISLMSPQPSKHTASATRLSTEDFLRSLQLETAIHSAVKSPTATTNTSTVRDEKPTLSTSTTSPNLYSCKRIRIELLNTWGDDTYIGLTGLQLLQGHDLVSVPLTAGLVHTMPRDLSSLGIYDDPRVSANLISNENNTTNERCMWLAPYTHGSRHEVELTLDTKRTLAGMRVWNYNRYCSDGEEVLRGVRAIKIFLDEKLLGFWELRIAPGVDGLDFGQTILFEHVASPSISRCPGIQLQTQNFDNQYKCLKIGCHNASDGYLRQDYEPPVLPTGQLWTITIHENWNDPYYVGLDGIEFIDSNGSILDVLACGGSIQALPYSVTILAQDDTKNVLSIDPRIPQALLSCTTRTGTGNILASSDNHHVRPSACRCWLAPLTRRMSDAEKKRSAGPQILGSQTHSYSSHLARFPHDNCLYVMFPYPVTVSCVRLLNYSKTPARGVKEMSLHVDGRLIYMGNLKQASKDNRIAQSILFSNDLNVLKKTSSTMNYCGTTEQDVLCVNERQIMVRARSLFDQPNAASEGVHANLDKRPVTAFIL